MNRSPSPTPPYLATTSYLFALKRQMNFPRVVPFANYDSGDEEEKVADNEDDALDVIYEEDADTVDDANEEADIDLQDQGSGRWQADGEQMDSDINRRFWQEAELVELYGEMLRMRDLGGVERYMQVIEAEGDSAEWKHRLGTPIQHLHIDLGSSDHYGEYRLPDQTIITGGQAIVNTVASALHLSLDNTGLVDHCAAPFSHLQRIDIRQSYPESEHGHLDDRQPYETIRLVFGKSSAAPANAAPKLQCVTGRFLDCPLTRHLSELVRPDYQRTFTVHVDTGALGRDIKPFLQSIPLPKHVQHLIVTFSPQNQFLLDVVQPPYVHPLKAIAHIRIKDMVSCLQSLRRPPLLLDIRGLYNTFEGEWWASMDLVGDDGIRRTRPMLATDDAHAKYGGGALWRTDDQTRDVLRKRLQQYKVKTHDYRSIDEAINVTTDSPDMLVSDDKLGHVRITSHRISQASVCDDCQLALCSTVPLAYGSTIPPEYATSTPDSKVRVFFCGRG